MAGGSAADAGAKVEAETGAVAELMAREKMGVAPMAEMREVAPAAEGEVEVERAMVARAAAAPAAAVMALEGMAQVVAAAQAQVMAAVAMAEPVREVVQAEKQAAEEQVGVVWERAD